MVNTVSSPATIYRVDKETISDFHLTAEGEEVGAEKINRQYDFSYDRVNKSQYNPKEASLEFKLSKK
jgi:hypothetical protein